SIMRCLQSPKRVFRQNLAAHPEVGTKRALQLPLDSPDLVRICIDCQKKRSIAPLLAIHDTRLSK
ncbi:MAG TPA: hypothetical protein VK390_08615, partial [Propionibacteriaceae bacterium]|nr:hypothetical protein [Propionibacteriaceae bacterium]